jgi:hypothetical protein
MQALKPLRVAETLSFPLSAPRVHTQKDKTTHTQGKTEK